MQLLGRIRQLLLSPRDFLHELGLVEGLLGDDLSAEILDLVSEPLLDRVVLLPHDVAPNRIQFVEDLRNCSLGHRTLEVVLDPHYGANSLRRDPVVVDLGLLATKVRLGVIEVRLGFSRHRDDLGVVEICVLGGFL